jgi:hypothetical protein
MSPLLSEIQQRWRLMFSTLAAGNDLPPTQRLRTEGLMEAVVLNGEQTAQRLHADMDAVYREVYDHALADDFGLDWQDFYPFPQIPAVAKRAPVYPSTSE